MRKYKWQKIAETSYSKCGPLSSMGLTGELVQKDRISVLHQTCGIRTCFLQTTHVIVKFESHVPTGF